MLKSCYYVPDFKNIKLGQDEDGNYHASVDVVGSCYKTNVGFSLQSKSNSNDHVNSYYLLDYTGSMASVYSTFYNKPSTAPLIVYPLVKFGDIEMIAEPSAECGIPTYTCPDNNHPHAIDLGLPSGTKWCCCNVGATSPEEYGGYYAWGETSEKSTYTASNYAYYVPNSYNFINIGNEISGTSYDVAYVRMGGAWHIPTHEQILELVYKCTSVWTQLNGVNGRLITGHNGGQIFLPAAGFGWEYGINGASISGEYWASSICYDNNAYSFIVNSYNLNWQAGYNRSLGLSVRAVCP